MMGRLGRDASVHILIVAGKNNAFTGISQYNFSYGFLDYIPLQFLRATVNTQY